MSFTVVRHSMLPIGLPIDFRSCPHVPARELLTLTSVLQQPECQCEIFYPEPRNLEQLKWFLDNVPPARGLNINVILTWFTIELCGAIRPLGDSFDPVGGGSVVVYEKCRPAMKELFHQTRLLRQGDNRGSWLFLLMLQLAMPPIYYLPTEISEERQAKLLSLMLPIGHANIDLHAAAGYSSVPASQEKRPQSMIDALKSHPEYVNILSEYPELEHNAHQVQPQLILKSIVGYRDFPKALRYREERRAPPGSLERREPYSGPTISRI